jgi:predicted N-formylglutamate amidohydrolase
VIRWVILSCEHAGNELPAQYHSLFSRAKEVLASHRGWDPGAIDFTEYLAHALKVEWFAMYTSRLVIEMNRSLDSPQLLSEFTNKLSDSEKQELISNYYLPYRNTIEEKIKRAPKPALHISIHTFTPVWNGVQREVDIGLLFDPEREPEASFCELFRNKLQESLPGLQIRFNEPYLGTDDGFTTYLRNKFTESDYLGIEIEINQRFINTPEAERIQEKLSLGIRECLL